MTAKADFRGAPRGALSRRSVVFLGAGVAGSLALGQGRAFATRPTLVAAASSLRFVVEEIVGAHERAGGAPVRVSFGATGTLVAQIESRAPFEVFLAADVASAERLAQAGLTTDGPKVFATGQIAVVAARDLGLENDDRLLGVGKALKDGRIRRLAIANPELAPYGAAARQALMATGLWEDAQARLALGENIGQAAQFVASGAAQVGILARSLALAPEVAGRLQVFGVNEALYTPIEHGMVVMKDARPEARAFAAFFASPAAREILIRGGFSA